MSFPSFVQSFPIGHLLTLAHGGGASGGGFSFPLLHPIFVNFTAALIPTSFVADLLGGWFKKDGLRMAGWWTMLLAGILTPLTALFGWLWFLSGMNGQGTPIQIHQWLGTTLAVVVVGLAIWRGRRYAKSGNRPGWAYALAAIIVTGGLMVQGDVGASMSFGRGIVVSGASSHEHGEQGHAEHEHEHEQQEHAEHEQGGGNRDHAHEGGDARGTRHQGDAHARGESRGEQGGHDHSQ